MSSLESVAKQIKGTINQCIYEGKFNDMHAFWCVFYFSLESYPYEGKLPKYP